MRIFEHMNTGGKEGCLICGKKTDEPTVLIPISGTESGSLMQAKQCHVGCLNVIYYPDKKLLVQILNEDCN